MCFNTHVDAPAPRDLAKETQDTLATQIALAPDQLAAYQQTAPGYAQTDVNILGQSLFGPDFQGNLSDINRRLTNEAATQSQQANTAQREADLADVQRLSPAVLAAQRAANPELFGSLDALDATAKAGIAPGTYESMFGAAASRASDRYNPAMVSSRMSNPTGRTAIESALERQALGDLSLGDQMSPEEQRLVRVQSRAAADARGRGFSNAALADEVLNTAQARQDRLNTRRAFAADTNTALRSGMAADRSYGLAKDTFRSGIDQFNQQLGLSTAGFNASRADADRAALDRAAQFEAARRGEDWNRQLSATQARLSTFSDPFQGVLGRSSTNAGSNASLFGNAAGTAGASASQTRGMFDSFNSYSSDLYNTNYNGAAAANIASGNNRAAVLGGLFSGLGSLGGGLFAAA
jgi:hypothetical protein